ncbi:hypothetical protein sos41_27590 [Alphaproteobacteria bacterium SO-S41]|nr:hypothetical protein sos41_27590 [Alphaproteobacteria bacterium SO-S41]
MITVTGAVGDFDFQEGHWTVRHEARTRDGGWATFEGECSMRKAMGGQANLEDHVWRRETTEYRAVGLRTFDPARAVWSIFWVDARWPATVGSPVVGGFAGNEGTFYSEEEADGVKTLTRFSWTVDDDTHCRWEQASSADDGRSWETNWRMWFTRA